MCLSQGNPLGNELLLNRYNNGISCGHFDSLKGNTHRLAKP
jgi:hypothetical protein